MNPAGLRIEEKKSAEGNLLSTNNINNNKNNNMAILGALMDDNTTTTATYNEAKSSPGGRSYKSTHSSRSSVLERAREYNRRIDEQNHRLRTKSLERGVAAASADDKSSNGGLTSSSIGGGSSTTAPHHHHHTQQRSHSVGRVGAGGAGGNRMSTRERAMASVRREATATTTTSLAQQQLQAPLTPSTVYTSSISQPTPPTMQQQTLKQQQQSHHHSHVHQQQQRATHRQGGGTAAPAAAPTTPPPQQPSHPYSSAQQQKQQSHLQQKQKQPPQPQPPSQQQHHGGAGGGRASRSQQQQPHHQSRHSPGSNSMTTTSRSQSSHQRGGSPAPGAASGSRGGGAHHHHRQPSYEGGGGANANKNNNAAVVTPELLVDALSGHEDGLLAIAERLMEHYDSGYDVMGESIIDAFADVQKLFQHVVEAAHMEGAAFEATRREEEITELRRQAAAVAALSGVVGAEDFVLMDLPGEMNNNNAGVPSPASPSMPPRHDEFIDQDVKDLLTDAIRKGSMLRDSNKHTECYELYDRACQAASSLLPVDSDHRGRLQLSIARADSMTADRACAILRYAMDDVLRSGMRAVRTPLPDPSQRADVVLSRPVPHLSSTTGPTAVVQSANEALQSLIDELKEILSAPVYSNSTPLQTVAKRFWAALADAQKMQNKNEERLEQQLGKLKGDYLLAKAEWEEKLNQANERTESYKIKYERLKESTRGGGEHYLDQAARSFSSHHPHHEDHDMSAMYSVKSTPSKTGSVASFGSGLAQQAKTLVNTMNNFNCTALNERTGSAMETELREADMQYETASRRHPHYSRSGGGGSGGTQQNNRGRSTSASRKTSRSFREYSRSPQRVDV